MSASAPAGAASAASLDARVQDVKSDVIRLNRDLLVLEEELLFPANTQVAVFVSMDVGKMFELGSVLIRESTHPFSPLSVHRSMVGRRRSLVRSALGRAILTASKPSLRREMLETTAAFVAEDAPLARDRRFIDDIVAQTRNDGYASSVGGSEAGISAIALPIQSGGPVLGSLNLIFFSSSMTPAVAAKRYLPDMKQAVKEIERRWSAANSAQGKVA